MATLPLATSVTCLLLVLTSLVGGSDTTKDKASGESPNFEAYAEIASSLLSAQNAQNIGGIIGNLVQSDGAKQLGDMLAGMAQNKNANDILQTIGSVVMAQQGGGSGMGGGLDLSALGNIGAVLSALSSAGDNKKSGGGGGGFDPSLLGEFLNVLSSSAEHKKSADVGGGDFSDLLSTVGGLLGGGAQGSAGLESLMSFLPTITNTINSFGGEEAKKRADEHAEHAWLLPPVLEKIHVLLDHLANSDLGKLVLTNLGAEKFLRVFADENGKFNFTKFAELLENRSFRKHWIESVTKRIAVFVSYFADPQTQHKFLTAVQYFANTWLKTQGFPKSALLDWSRPAESMASFVNHVSKKYLNVKIQAKTYVKPAVQYVQDIFKLAQKRGFLGGIDSAELSNKLADTINMEIIEPVARVYRAYRFAKKVPACDKYVMCLVNKDQPGEAISLPGLKSLLSKFTSVVAGWFLSSHTGTSFWSLYASVMDGDCRVRHVDACDHFHVEELKVTTEYMHNEL